MALFVWLLGLLSGTPGLTGADLGHPDWKRREAAARLLTRGWPLTGPDLFRAAHSPDPATRRRAAVIAATAGDRSPTGRRLDLPPVYAAAWVLAADFGDRDGLPYLPCAVWCRWRHAPEVVAELGRVGAVAGLGGTWPASATADDMRFRLRGLVPPSEWRSEWAKVHAITGFGFGYLYIADEPGAQVTPQKYAEAARWAALKRGRHGR